RITVSYDLPPDGWYFAASPADPLAYGILLEIALQPCGWLTAWQGCAFKLGGDLYFRNLGGTASQHTPLWPHSGTLTSRAHLTSVSESAGMMLAAFDFTVHAGDVLVYEGNTNFGYFRPEALAAQKGLQLSAESKVARTRWRNGATGEIVDLADTDSLPGRDLRMIDRVSVVAPSGGAAGLGYYEAQKDVRPEEWFFSAHFHQDPVMPGSLGVEALMQLARWVLLRETGSPPARVGPIADGSPCTWKYRGQVTRDHEALTYELEVKRIDRERGEIWCDGLVRADGLPIYSVEDLGVRLYPDAPPPPAPSPHPREGAAAALLDSFFVDGNTGHGVLRLDPAQHPWLRDHQPTLVIPALPMTFAAEIAAEAAVLVCPGRKVVGIPEVRAEKWIHTADGPRDVVVVAVAEGDLVAVTLAVQQENRRFPKLSGPKVHMRAVVRVGDDWATTPADPPVLAAAEPVTLSVRDFYDGGAIFHGPLLQALSSLGTRGPTGAQATIRTCADSDLLPPGSPGFVLDPLVLDAATHPMMSGLPETWNQRIPTGRLAYPVACDDLRFHGPRPGGEVACRLDLVEANAERLVFDVRLSSRAGPWATFRWTEVLVPGGTLLGRTPEEIRVFCKERRAADVRVGCAAAGGWRVAPSDLVEPLAGTLARLLCTPAEVAEPARSEDGLRWQTARFAAKEAVRAHLRARLGRDVHAADVRIVALAPDRYAVTGVVGLTAQEQIDHLGPTRFEIKVHLAPDHTATARIDERAGAGAGTARS
ncbi:MAG: polyketide synthase dehydratase domain-containing protein, partial [Deltaproteobacteria bacterium]|nr:polyketide synthase dehydratase domain-containing protein [Deltaproteobacteria bacterium]